MQRLKTCYSAKVGPSSRRSLPFEVDLSAWSGIKHFTNISHTFIVESLTLWGYKSLTYDKCGYFIGYIHLSHD